MLSLRGARDSRGLVSGAEFAVKKSEREGIALQAEFGIITGALIAHEGMGTVEFVPSEVGPGGVQGGVDFLPTFEGNMGILSAPEHEQFASDFWNVFKGVVVHPMAEAAFVNIGRVKTNGGEHGGIHGRAEGQMTADANP